MNNLKLRRACGVVALLVLFAGAPAFAQAPHNLVLFVPDGLRSQIVDATTAPTLARLREQGVDFRNSHSLFPTFTTANASAFATGHHLGDTGDFGNYIYSGFSIAASGHTVTPFLGSNPVLRDLNEGLDGNYLNETSLVAAARAAGFSTAIIGKVGPAAILDVASLNGAGTLIVDDSTGAEGREVPLSAQWQEVFARSKVPLVAPGRGDNGRAGNSTTPGTWIANLAQQQYFLEVAIKAALPRFKEIGKPFVLVFWSRDPDGSQHNQGDSFHSLTPGINGPTSLSAIRNADGALASIEQALVQLGLYEETNIIVAADHGFSTISKASRTSPSTKVRYAGTLPGELPLGFLAIDLATALKREDRAMKLFDPDDSNHEVEWSAGRRPVRGNALIGRDVDHPQVVVAANGGSDLIYLPGAPGRAAKNLARKIVAALLDQDYVSGIFVDEARFGEIAGALSTESIGLGGGKALTPHPAIVVNFASRVIEGCAHPPSLCSAQIADTGLQEGQGMHGSFSRADTWNFMAARGPDFRSGYVDELPASNADIGMTMSRLLRLSVEPKGNLLGRVLTEALRATPSSEPLPLIVRKTIDSRPDARHGLRTTLKIQSVDGHVYLDVAGFPGRTVGLDGPSQ